MSLVTFLTLTVVTTPFVFQDGAAEGGGQGRAAADADGAPPERQERPEDHGGVRGEHLEHGGVRQESPLAALL